MSGSLDWGSGRYEETARGLVPAATAAVEAAGPLPGATLLDVACGTGNAALAAAARGALVTGIDVAPRLVDVAAERARAAGVEGNWVVGDATALPFADASFDVAVSVFGVIFADDARTAAAELLRVVRPGGRVVITAWIDRGPLADALGRARTAFVEHVPPAPGDEPQARVDWSNPAVLGELFGGAPLEIVEAQLAFTASCARAWVESQDAHHPFWQLLRSVVPPERYAALLDELVAVLEDANEDAAAWRVNSPYLVVRADAGER